MGWVERGKGTLAATTPRVPLVLAPPARGPIGAAPAGSNARTGLQGFHSPGLGPHPAPSPIFGRGKLNALHPLPTPKPSWMEAPLPSLTAGAADSEKVDNHQANESLSLWQRWRRAADVEEHDISQPRIRLLMPPNITPSPNTELAHAEAVLRAGMLSGRNGTKQDGRFWGGFSGFGGCCGLAG